jgi:Tfp pilus assembly protein PilN
MTAWRDNFQKTATRLAPGARGFWAWWRRSLLAWLPPRWQQQLGLSRVRLLLSRNGETLRIERDAAGQCVLLAEMPWPQSPGDVETLLGPRLSALPCHWLLPAHSVLRRSLRLPAAAATRLRDVVGFEIDRQTPFTADQVHFDARVIGHREDGQLDVELVVVPRTTLDALAGQGGTWKGALAGVDAADAQGLPLGVNLLPPQARQQRRDPMQRWNRLLALAAVVALVGGGWQLLDNRRQAARNLQAQVDVAAQRARTVGEQRQQLQDLVDGAAFFDRQRAQRPPAVEVWNELSQRLPDGTWLEKFSLEGGQLQLIGLSDSASSLVGRLEGSRLWRTPALTGVLQGDDGSRRDRFTLTAELQAAPAPRAEAADGDATHVP